MLLTIFVTSDQGILMHDLQTKPEKADALTQVAIPYLYFLKNVDRLLTLFLSNILGRVGGARRPGGRAQHV